MIDQCEHKRVYLKAQLPSGITIGFCADCCEAVILAPVVVPVFEMLDHNWQVTFLAERLGIDRHKLGNRLTEMQAEVLSNAPS